MAELQFTFKRYEEKYMLSEEQYQRLRSLLGEYMEEDPHGQSTICNIYYDTDTYALVSRSLEKPVYKEKFRVRSYGVAREDSEVFVEIKKKYDGVVYKRRVRGIPDTARRFIQYGERLSDNAQIQNEISWFLQYYKPEPKMFIGYEREAFFGKNDHEFRLTFDRNIRYRLERLDLQEGDDGTVILPEGRVLMELKTIAAVPVWMSGFLSDERLYPVSFSKYGTCYKRELAIKQQKVLADREAAASRITRKNENQTEETVCITAF